MILQGRSNISLATFVITKESLILSNLGFKVGDIIEIDLDIYYVTHNGIDITYKVSGGFFKLYSGLNTINWKNDVNERSVKKDIKYQNKFL